MLLQHHMVDYSIFKAAVPEEQALIRIYREIRIVFGFFWMDNGEHLVLVARLDKCCDALRGKLECGYLIPLPVEVFSRHVLFWAEVLADPGEEAAVVDCFEEGVDFEGAFEDVS